MLTKIGNLSEPSDIVDLLNECHDRIRAFIGLAGRLAKAEEITNDEIRDAATRVTKYFSEALPLHVADEEQSILPRLQGKTVEVDSALLEMQKEHSEHELQVETLLGICRSLQASPERLNELREHLRESSSTLERDFFAHLDKEEKVILPAIRRLATREERDAMLRELRDRRNRA
jgi:iron-sulfur cluster repair protein YtfE (RIC family)